MNQLHFDVNQLNIIKSMGVLHLFAWNYVNYANMEGFHRDSHICAADEGPSMYVPKSNKLNFVCGKFSNYHHHHIMVLVHV